MLHPSRDKNEGAYRGGEGGENSLLSDLGSELRLATEEEKEKVRRL